MASDARQSSAKRSLHLLNNNNNNNARLLQLQS